MTIDSFGKTAQRFASNPLGIIALFIVLVYGIAGFVFGASAEYLETTQINIVIIFLVGFPVVVLAVFVLLVTRHSTKLYAPKDFQDASTYLRTLSYPERKEKIEEEINEIVSATHDINNSNESVENGAPDYRETLRSKVHLIEDLVLRDIEAEYTMPIARQLSFPGGDFSVDGMLNTTDGDLCFIEVKYCWKKLPNSVIDQLSYHKKFIHETFGWKSLKFILAAVFDQLSTEEIEMEKSRISDLLSQNEKWIDLRVYDYYSLLKKYRI